jgi:hypothetical protein
MWACLIYELMHDFDMQQSINQSELNAHFQEATNEAATSSVSISPDWGGGGANRGVLR